MTTHNLKCYPVPFTALAENRKTFEFRRSDREYAVGDCLCLRCWGPRTQDFTNDPAMRFEVIHIMHGPQFGLPEGYCVMSLRRLS